MLSKKVKWRISANRRARKHLWKMRRKYGLNRAAWPKPWTIAFNQMVERAGDDVFGEVFFPTMYIIEPDPATKKITEDWIADNMYPLAAQVQEQIADDAAERLRKIGRGLIEPVIYTTAYHRQAERVERNEQIQAIMRLPKAIDFPGLRERITLDDPRHPLNFARQGWSPEVTVILPRNGTQELKVVPKHRHHHWAHWAYEERTDENHQDHQGALESGLPS